MHQSPSPAFAHACPRAGHAANTASKCRRFYMAGDSQEMGWRGPALRKLATFSILTLLSSSTQLIHIVSIYSHWELGDLSLSSPVMPETIVSLHDAFLLLPMFFCWCRRHFLFFEDYEELNISLENCLVFILNNIWKVSSKPKVYEIKRFVSMKLKPVYILILRDRRRNNRVTFIFFFLSAVIGA